MKLRKILSALLASAALAFGALAHADPISGGITLAGNGTPQGSTTHWFDSTGVNFINPWVVLAGNGSYGTVPMFTTFVTMSSFSWGAGSGVVNIAGGPAWAFTAGGDTYTLTGDFITAIVRGNLAADGIIVSGTGILTISGNHCGPTFSNPCSPTAGVWNFTAGVAGTQTNLSFSAAANVPTVPEPGTLALVGLALAGIALVRIRKQA